VERLKSERLRFLVKVNTKAAMFNFLQDGEFFVSRRQTKIIKTDALEKERREQQKMV